MINKFIEKVDYLIGEYPLITLFLIIGGALALCGSTNP